MHVRSGQNGRNPPYYAGRPFDVLLFKEAKMIRFTAVLFAAIFMMAPQNVFAQGAANASPPPAEFFSEMQDIPVVPGITEVIDQTVTFDKPEGRIVESVAEIESGDSASVTK